MFIYTIKNHPERRTEFFETFRNHFQVFMYSFLVIGVQLETESCQTLVLLTVDTGSHHSIVFCILFVPSRIGNTVAQ